MLVVAIVLLVVNACAKHLLTIDMVAALAVLLSFGHAQISDRMAEKQGELDRPTVECYRKMWAYFFGKEICWLTYFCVTQAYSALVGVFVFLAYPIWRRIYRSRNHK